MARRPGLWTLFGLIVFSASARAQAPASTRALETRLYAGGPIVTMVGDAPTTVDALATRGSTIIAVGTLAQVQAAAGSGAVRVDLRGRALLPGFIDAHGHVSEVGHAASLARLSPPPVGDVNSIESLQAALRRYIAETNPGPGVPVVGFGYDDSQLAERRHPVRQDLDAVSADRPILITHASGHLAVMNTAMLRLVGYGPDTPNPAGGVIRRDSDGRTPNGVLEESAVRPAFRYVSAPNLDAAVAAVVEGEKIYIAHGITTAQDGRVFPEQWPGLAEAGRRGVLPLDTVVLISFDRDWPADVRSRIGKPYASRLRIAGVKFGLDGSPQGRTAWLSEPVWSPPEGKGADYRGYPAMDPADFRRRLKDAGDNGWQVFAHVNGDQAVQELIDGVRETGLSGKRTIAIHAQVMRPEQLLDFKALDIQPSFFASHTWYWGDWHREVALGPKRADFISPQASAWRAGLTPTAHNDSPVAPPDILRLVWSSVTRRTQSGDILGPLERVSVYRALQQVTINAAWQIHEETTKGSLAVGSRADLVVLDANPLSIDPADLFKIKVVATIRDGDLVYGSLK